MCTIAEWFCFVTACKLSIPSQTQQMLVNGKFSQCVHSSFVLGTSWAHSIIAFPMSMFHHLRPSCLAALVVCFGPWLKLDRCTASLHPSYNQAGDINTADDENAPEEDGCYQHHKHSCQHGQACRQTHTLLQSACIMNI